MEKNRTSKTGFQSDEGLAQRIATGEVALFAILMKRHNQKLYRIARGMGIGSDECDDLIQLTYIQAYLKLPQFRGESTFATWLTRILINQCLMFSRKQRPNISEQGSMDGLETEPVERGIHHSPTPESEMIKRELRAVLEHAIEQLPDDYRIVYVMREIEEMSVNDISASLGITVSNVKVRIHRARKLLHAQLRDYLDPSELYEFGSTRCDAIVRDVLQIIQKVL